VTGCSVATNPITVNAGQTVSVPVYFTTGAAGQVVSIDLHATMSAHGVTFADDGTVQVVPTAATVQVTPLDGTPGVATNGSGTYHFQVADIGNATPTTYTLQVTGCTAPITSCSAPDSITVYAGSPQTVAVNYSTTGTGGTGSITLRAFKQYVHLYESSATANVNVTSRLLVSTAFMNNDDQDMSLCVASCFAMTATRSTVPYYTLDTPRSVTLAYNGDRAFPRPFIYADVSVPSAPSSVQSYTLEVKRLGVDLPFINGETKLTFQGTGTPAASYRLAGQVDMSSYPSGIDSVTVLVTALYANGQSDITPVKTQLMIVNSALNTEAAPIAKGWRIAGMQFLRATPEGVGSPGGGFMIENGDGSATYFASNGATGADFSRLVFDNVATWIRTYQDSSRVLFDGGGRMLAAIDRLGRETQFSYGGPGNWSLIRITEPMRMGGTSTSAPYLSLAYDANNRLSAITEAGGANGRTTNVTVDANGNLTRVTDPDGGYDSYGYDPSGRLHTITDRRGNTTTYNYGPTWKLSQVVSPPVPIDAGGGTTASGTPIVSLAPWQAVGVPFDTTAGNPAPLMRADTIAARVSDANGQTSMLFPDRWGEALKTVDALGNTTVVQRQGFLPTVVTHPDGSTDYASYNLSNGLLLNQHMAGQQTVSYTYGNRNQLQTVSGSGVVGVTNTLDSLGRVIKTAYGTVAGDTTVFTYDPVTKNVASAIQPDAGLTTYQYDAQFGNLATTTDPGSRVTQSYFDAYGRSIATKTPQYPMATTQYDVVNRVTSEHNGYSADSVRIKYDGMLPVSVRDPLSHVDSTEYDAGGKVTRHFGYASATAATTTRYDLAGRPTSVTNRRGQQIDVTYDALGRVLSKTDGSTTDVFTYSADGLTRTATNATASVRMVSVPTDLLDTVQTTVLASGVTQHTYTVVHHQSDQAGGTDSTVISSDGAPAQFVTRRYIKDATNGTLNAINLGGSIGQGTFTSDVAGWRTGTAWPSAGRTSVFLSTGTHAYETYGSLDPAFYAGYRVDSAGRILRDHRHYGSASTYTNRIFGYDRLGRYTGTTTVSDAQYPWGCGGSGRLDPDYGYVGCAIDSVPTPNVYGYDDVGNRTGGGIHYGIGDQVTSSDGFSYTYDADGNVTTRTKTSTGLVWTYSWSADNRLLGASKSDGTSVSFDYDALGQPVVKRGSQGEATRVTLFDGGSILADLDAVGYRQAEYVYDEGTDRPYAMLTGQTTVSAVRYYAQDDMGNVQGQFPDHTVATETVTYGDWGLPSITGETTNRLTWKGLSYDPDVGLTYMRSRWYDSNIGRFVSEDPLGLQGGINPYVFANDDPINGSDPSGMCDYSGSAQELPCINVTAIQDGDPGIDLTSEFETLLEELGSRGSGGSIGDGGGGGGGTPSAPKANKPKSRTECAIESGKSNGLALGLDVATIGVDVFVPEVGLAAGLIQGATAAKAAVQGGIAIVAFANSGLRKDTPGAIAGVAGFELTSVGLFAKGIGGTFEAATRIGGRFFAGVAIVRDSYKAYTEYQACRAGQ